MLHAIDGYAGLQTRSAIQFLAFTFVRTSELIGMRWDEIDFSVKRWNIPSERMKMKTPHIVPLSTQALEALRRFSGDSQFVFPSRSGNKPMSNNTILVALKRMGCQGEVTGHGFRGIASTLLLHEQQYDHQHIEAQLAHSRRDAVSAAYNHALYLPQRAKMMQDWADFLDQQRHGAKVLHMKEATQA